MGRKHGYLNGVNEVVLVPVAPEGVTRDVRRVNLWNADTVACEVTLAVKDSGKSYIQAKITLTSGGHLLLIGDDCPELGPGEALVALLTAAATTSQPHYSTKWEDR